LLQALALGDTGIFNQQNVYSVNVASDDSCPAIVPNPFSMCTTNEHDSEPRECEC
jgi:hypothetical protein